MGFIRYVLRRLGGREPRVVHRVAMHCPHSGEPVEIELQIGRTGKPAMVLRCNRRDEAPPTCDEACRNCAEAVAGPPLALLMIPAGEGPPDQPC
jgi:hypothetical protein